MCLIVLAPLVSQLIAAHRAQLPDAALCSAVLSVSSSHPDGFVRLTGVRR